VISSMQSIIPSILARQPGFSQLPTSEIERLCVNARTYLAGKNEQLYAKGATPEGVYLLLNGQVKLTLLNAHGGEKIAEVIDAGETFAEESVFSGLPSPFTAQTNRESILLILPRGMLEQAMQRYCGIGAVLMVRMGKRLFRLAESLETCVQRGSTQRVAHFFSQHAPQNADTFDIQLDMNKQSIAAQLNLAPETFSRVLRKLTQNGLIAVRGRSVHLHDLKSLRALAG